MEWSGVEWNGVKWSAVEWNGVEWNGVEWSRMEWSGMGWNEIGMQNEWNGKGMKFMEMECNHVTDHILFPSIPFHILHNANFKY